ncbi:unnamed protein product [Rotaria magnacalcarata]|uniref:Uncharacterized protein n=1 Tax=Rotaria magnacalcarata TaxID=392030 RepID=A0A8S2TG92_9BILA|nr:unnamed protein product [Rotaria magnacalcarata]
MKAALNSSIDLDTFDRFLYDIGISSWSDIQYVLPPKQQQLDLNNAKSVCAYADKLFRHHDDSVAGMEVATWYLKAIDLEGKLQPVNYLNLFKMYLKVAECLENDKIYYDKAKNIVTNLTDENGPLQTARLYFKLAQHCSLYSDRDHGEALNCYLACLHTQQEALPENDLNIALTYKQIATLHNDHLSRHEIREPSFSEYLARSHLGAAGIAGQYDMSTILNQVSTWRPKIIEHHMKTKKTTKLSTLKTGFILNVMSYSWTHSSSPSSVLLI